MRRDFTYSKKLVYGLVALLGLSLVISACGDQAPANTAVSNATTAPAVSAAPTNTTSAITFQSSDATSTPVILPTRQGGIPTVTLPPATTAAAAATRSPASTTAAATRSPASTAAAATTAPATTAVVANTTAASATPTKASQIAPVTGFPGKLSIVSNDYYIYVTRFDGKAPQLLLGKAGVTVNQNQDGEVFQFPTWTRDGSKMAVTGVNIKGGNTDSIDVYVVTADGSTNYKVQDADKFSPVYLSWSPDGNFLTLLLGNTGSNKYDLRIADTSKGAASIKSAGLRVLTQGSPLYSSWSSDSDSLLIHTQDGTNETLSMIKAKDTKSTLQTLKPGGNFGAFRAPAWSADGTRHAFSSMVTGQTNESIVVQGKDGAQQGTIDGTGVGAAFNWSPNGAKLAHGFRTDSQSRFYTSLNLSDLGGADAPKSGKISSTKIVDSQVAAFFWSPDGKKLAYVTINDARTRLVWNVYDLDSKKSTKLAEWIPSDELNQVIAFFDQYAQSDSIWSPDSKALVFGGWVNSTVSPTQVEGDPIVYVMPTEGAKVGQTQPVAPGGLAFWAK